MNIAHFTSFGLGGADKCAFNLIKGLTELGHNIKVFYNSFSFPNFMPNEHNVNYKPLSRYDDYIKLNNVELIEIKNVKEFHNYNIDILNTHRSGNDMWLLPNFEHESFKFKVVESNFHGNLKTKADIRVFPSNAMVNHKKLNNSSHIVIPNPIMTPQSSDNLRDELNIGDKFVYGRIARPEKNIYSSLNLSAYKEVENDNNVFLYVSYPQIAKDDAQKLGIKNIIFLEPTIDEIRISKIYNTMDVHCHSNSIGETFGNTVAESFMHSTPCVTHKGSSNWTQAQKELVGDHQELFTTNVGDYASRMRQLENDKEYYNQVAQYNKNRADSLYDYRKVAEKYLELYERL
jgi:glycosyltransferase involved in cell wall biosynthesis